MKHKRTQNKAQARKTKFRRSSKWIKFRKHMKQKQKVCAVTGKPLGPTSNLHHLDLNEDNYEKIDNEDNFVFLNKTPHDVVHWLWGKGNNDWRGRLKALWKIMYKMERINNATKDTQVTQDSR